MKTVEQWAQELPEDVREKFLANMVRDNGEIGLKLISPSLGHAIAGFFVWRKSPEGHDYWSDIYNKIQQETR